MAVGVLLAGSAFGVGVGNAVVGGPVVKTALWTCVGGCGLLIYVSARKALRRRGSP